MAEELGHVGEERRVLPRAPDECQHLQAAEPKPGEDALLRLSGDPSISRRRRRRRRRRRLLFFHHRHRRSSREGDRKRAGSWGFRPVRNATHHFRAQDPIIGTDSSGRESKRLPFGHCRADRQLRNRGLFFLLTK